MPLLDTVATAIICTGLLLRVCVQPFSIIIRTEYILIGVLFYRYPCCIHEAISVPMQPIIRWTCRAHLMEHHCFKSHWHSTPSLNEAFQYDPKSSPSMSNNNQPPSTVNNSDNNTNTSTSEDDCESGNIPEFQTLLPTWTTQQVLLQRVNDWKNCSQKRAKDLVIDGALADLRKLAYPPKSDQLHEVSEYIKET